VLTECPIHAAATAASVEATDREIAAVERADKDGAT